MGMAADSGSSPSERARLEINGLSLLGEGGPLFHMVFYGVGPVPEGIPGALLLHNSDGGRWLLHRRTVRQEGASVFVEWRLDRRRGFTTDIRRADLARDDLEILTAWRIIETLSADDESKAATDTAVKRRGAPKGRAAHNRYAPEVIRHLHREMVSEYRQLETADRRPPTKEDFCTRLLERVGGS
ncbi:MAG TPA: hypothetical protein VG370_33190, partial [Chloroflexota bacterium]|nr:hypothetical protein [Chloroflexota bacterium]